MAWLFGRTPGADGSFSWEKTDKAATLARAAGIAPKKSTNGQSPARAADPRSTRSAVLQ